MSQQSYRVLLVDEHAIVRRGLKVLLQTEPDIVVSGEAPAGQEALEQVRGRDLDMVVLEPNLPDVDGFELILAIRRLSPTVEILILTVRSSPDAARAALGAGARGYALKSDEPSEFIRAVRSIRQHQPYITPHLKQPGPRNSIERLPHPPLSRREVVVVTLLANGFDNKRIALLLGISRRTVEAHRAHIMRKLRCESFSELIRFAVRCEMAESLDPGAARLFRPAAPSVPGARVLIPRGAFGKTQFCSESLLASIRIDRNDAP